MKTKSFQNYLEKRLTKDEIIELEKQAKYNAWKEKYDPVAGRAEIIVAKQRHGSTGIVRVRFDGRTTKFSDAADEGYLPDMRS